MSDEREQFGEQLYGALSDYADELQPAEQQPENPAEAIPSAADPERIRRTIDSAKRQQEEADTFWRGVLADRVGRREMWRLIQEAGGFNPPFECGPNGFPQEQATWFRAGQYAFAQRLYQSWMKVDPVGLKLMHDEHDPRFAKPRRVSRRRREPD